jgi:drug/metabolite transporter (DMT)-like permease
MRSIFDLSAWSSPAIAIASAVLFGASTPLAKRLLGEGVDPWLLAGLLYLGSGSGLTLIHCGRRLLGIAAPEALLRRTDIPWLGLVVLFGGIIGPVLLMVGLTSTSASSAALLLNLEGLATMAIAWTVFHESVDRRLLAGAFAILAGAAILSWRGGSSSIGFGAIAIAGACVAWGIDNNLTRKLSAADPVQIAAIKGSVAGLVNLVLALLRGVELPGADATAGAAIVGFVGYGVSLVLFVISLRHLGTARTGAYFSTAPFIGALLGLVLFQESPSLSLALAAALMALGVYFHLSERHEHEHVHEVLDHEHRHTHDAHHQHVHEADDPAGEPHTHRHRHPPLRHKHPHYPDLHHRHGHVH